MNNVHKIQPKEIGTTRKGEKIILNIKIVHYYIFLLSRPLMSEIRQEIIRRCTNIQCAACGTPVLEHEYDIERDIALNWKSNCAIVPQRKLLKPY